MTAALGLDDNRELEAAIKAYIDATNAGPKPFRWTKSVDDILVAINRFCKCTIDEHRSVYAENFRIRTLAGVGVSGVAVVESMT